MDFSIAGVTLQNVDAVTQEVSVKQDVSSGGVNGDLVHDRLQNLHVAANGFGFEGSAITAGTDNGAIGGCDHHNAANVGEVHVSCERVKSHVAVNTGDGDASGIGADFQFGLFGHGDNVVGLKIGAACGGVQYASADFDAGINLLAFDLDICGG